jgi:hypothetical protein
MALRTAVTSLEDMDRREGQGEMVEVGAEGKEGEGKMVEGGVDSGDI